MTARTRRNPRECSTREELLDALWKPDRPHLQEAGEVCAGYWREYVRKAMYRGGKNAGLINSRVSEAPYAAAAWETLVSRGIVPKSWLNDPRRRFEHPHRDVLTRTPATIDFVLALASTMPGPLQVEALAEEAWVRAVAWVPPRFRKSLSEPMKHVVWDLRGDLRPSAMAVAPPLGLAAVWNELQPSPNRPGSELVSPLAMERAGYTNVIRTAVVFIDGAWAEAAYARPTWPNPLEPLREIICAGFYATNEYFGRAMRLSVPSATTRVPTES